MTAVTVTISHIDSMQIRTPRYNAFVYLYYSRYFASRLQNELVVRRSLRIRCFTCPDAIYTRYMQLFMYARYTESTRFSGFLWRKYVFFTNNTMRNYSSKLIKKIRYNIHITLHCFNKELLSQIAVAVDIKLYYYYYQVIYSYLKLKLSMQRFVFSNLKNSVNHRIRKKYIGFSLYFDKSIIIASFLRDNLICL